MDLINSLLSDKQPSSLIEEGIDPEKHAKITQHLCEKRKNLEDKIKDKERTDLEENVTALFQLKNDMAIFGITEVDYQAYLAKGITLRELPPHSPTASPAIDSMDNTG